LVTATLGSGGGVGLRIGVASSNGKPSAEGDLRQLLVCIESSPAFLRGLDRSVVEVEPLLEQMDAQYAPEPDRRMEFSERTA